MLVETGNSQLLGGQFGYVKRCRVLCEWYTQARTSHRTVTQWLFLKQFLPEKSILQIAHLRGHRT